MSVKALAFYLPQFHPTAENDQWWGAGFTEWRNVVRARPQFNGHYQPHLPADLGFYDLRVPEVRCAQADLAESYGIGGFCYWHYWFAGRRLLNRPLDEVAASGEPNFPFCVCWANENWTRVWDGQQHDVLIGQDYSEEDDRNHIRWLARLFEDPRYLHVDGKPLLLVYRTNNLPEPRRTTDLWRDEASRLGHRGLYLCRVESFADERGDPTSLGFDAAVEFQPDWTNLGKPLYRRRRWDFLRAVGCAPRAFGVHRVYSYPEVVERMLAKPEADYTRYRGVTPSWDNSPRRQRGAVILKDSAPHLYQRWLEAAIESTPETPDGEKLVFLNAWNEWAEGNHLEPDLEYGHGYLEATKAAIENRMAAGKTSTCSGSPVHSAVNQQASL